MAAVLAILEIVFAGGLLIEEVAEYYFQNEIRKLYIKYEDQFELMSELKNLMEQLDHKNFTLQLNNCIHFAKNNWELIYNSLEETNSMLKDITQKFPKVKAPNLNVKNFELNYSKILSTTTAIGTLIWRAVQGSTMGLIKSDWNDPKNMLKGFIPQNYKGSVLLAMRVFGLINTIQSFVKGWINISKLREQLKKEQEFFKEEGGFDKVQDDFIKFMNKVAVNLFNLAQCGRAAFSDVRNMFIIRGFLSIANWEIHREYIKKSDPEIPGLTDDFIIKSKDLLDCCLLTKDDENLNKKQKLQKMVDVFKKYLKEANPSKVFSAASQQLSQITTKYSLISQFVIDRENDVNRLLSNVMDYFSDIRDPDLFGDLAPEKKRIKDEKIMEKTFKKYLQIFKNKSNMKLHDANQATKNILFNSIISFTDDFYYDDITGTTLFKRNIIEAKNQDRFYKDILNNKKCEANIIPVAKSTLEEEKIEIEKWRGYAIDFNKNSGFRFWRNQDDPCAQRRYIRLQLLQTKLCSFEGIKLTVNQSLYLYEQNTIAGTKTLIKQMDLID